MTIQKDIKETIEKNVLKDINYVLRYKPLARNAKSAQHFSKMTIIKPIALNVYPHIYADLIQRFDRNEAIRRLKSLGLRVAKFYYSTFPHELKKSQKFTENFSQVAKSHMHEKLNFKHKIMENKKLKSYTIEIKNCFFCSEITPFETTDVPYCTSKSGIYENLYNIKSLYNRDMVPKLVQVNTIKSAEYDGDICQYKLIVID